MRFELTQAHWIRQSNALTTRPTCHIWYRDSWIFVELRKMEAIKNYADKDENELMRAKPIGLDSPTP
jgi:hypothetical protein